MVGLTRKQSLVQGKVTSFNMLIQQHFLKGRGLKNPHFFRPVFGPNQGLVPEASAPGIRARKELNQDRDFRFDGISCAERLRRCR